MSNSPLVDYVKISPNKSSPRNAAIDFITPHCTAWQCSIEALGTLFSMPQPNGTSSNYGIDRNGKIGMFVEESDRAWTSSSRWNDNRAITIECASEAVQPYTMNDIVYDKLIELCTDICRRNGKKQLIWISDKERALSYALHDDEMLLTVHCWYANKACPGQWLLSRMSNLAQRVTGRLQKQGPPYTVTIDTIGLRIRAGAGTNTKIVGTCPPGIYTIVEEKAGHGSVCGWGKLKSGVGWISLDYAERRD